MLFQVCCNVIKNAIDAMPDGGRLTITTAALDRDVVLRVEDTGVGLPENMDEIFEPFFTTKKPGEGTGLGLAICKDYVERLHGRITAERADPQGAVFIVSIPLASCVPPTTRRPGP
jgi:two-component system NtrC family sensor kinase